MSPQDELERAFIETKERMIPDAVEQTAKRTSHTAPGLAAEAGKADAASTGLPDEALSKQFGALAVASEDQQPQTEPVAPSASPPASQPENDAASTVPDTQDEKPQDKASPVDSPTKL